MLESRAITISFAILSASLLQSGATLANEQVVGRPRQGAVVSEQDAVSAQAARPQQSDRFFTDPRKLPEGVRTVLGITRAQLDEVQRRLESNIPEAHALPPAAFNGKVHPFTTKNASAEGEISPVDKFPWRAAGKLFMKSGGGTSVCSGTVIGNSLVVTAAHCVHDFGGREGGFVDAVTFEPARHGETRPFGTWVAKEWWIPKAYFDGTDVCSINAPGIVCENDVAVVVLEKNNNQFIAERTGKFGFKSDDYGYGNLFGNRVAQITQLGYPAVNYSGVTMVRTDALGYQQEPNNVIIGSAQTAGSSGSGWIMNFGTKTSFSGSPSPRDDQENQVVATTSWGFGNGLFMLQGASRFGKNTIYTNKSNIQSLWDSACAENPGFC